MRRDLPAGTVTFLFTDVEGSTKLLHELGVEGYAEKLAEQRRVVREACTARGGVEVDTQGDAFFVAFATAPEALEAARAITEGLASGPIALRIGLHTGRPLLTEEGYVGKDVHFAARVAAAAHGGQVVLSQATRTLLDARHPLVELGEHRLKDIPEPVPIFQLGDGQFPPLKTISNTNLPRPTSSFVGRERELQELLGRIDDGARLVTLTGPGGSGKTRLALEAATTLVPEYKAGVFWVGLASLRDPALVTETIGHTLGAKDGLADHIGEREMLLLLDNLEHVIEAAPELSALLASCPNLALLVTSRELLRVQGEFEYPVPPLAEAEAVSLFCERAQTAASEEITELCRRLDNLPLAVELAAARTKALSPAQILERLSQRLDLLKGGRDADPRQQTLRATIEWSYDLLSDEEQTLFGRLSVFSGGCRLEAAEEVCDADLDTLQSLVEKSLVRFSNQRYWMLETIREYASEQLERREDLERLRRRHGEHFARLARETPDDVSGRQRLAEDHDNLRSALEWAIREEPDDIALPVADALSNYWQLHGHFLEARVLLDEALRASDPRSEFRPHVLIGAGWMAVAQGLYVEARDFLLESRRLGRAHADANAEAQSVNALGVLAGREGKAAEAASCFEESAALARRLNDQLLESFALGNLARVLLESGEEDRAAEALDACLRLCREHGYRSPLGRALNTSSRIAADHDDFAGAVRLLKQSLDLAAEYGDRWLAAEDLEDLALLLLGSDEFEHAGRLLGAAQRLREEIRAPLGPFEQQRLQQRIDRAAAANSSLFLSALGAGQKMRFEEALALAQSLA